jgi:hypothetical protein
MTTFGFAVNRGAGYRIQEIWRGSSARAGLISYKHIVFAIFPISWGHFAVAEVTYRWTDENGTAVLSDRPPAPGTPYSEVSEAGGFKRPAGTVEPSSPADERSVSGQMPLPESRPKDGVSHGGAETVSPESALCDQANDNILKLDTLTRVRIEDRQDGSARDAITPMMAKTKSVSSRVKALERRGRMTAHSYHLGSGTGE